MTTREDRQLRCHRCGSAELVLRETRYEHAMYDGGLFVNDEGRIEARGDGWFTPGDIQPALTEIKCEACGHVWHPRRAFAGSRRPESAILPGETVLSPPGHPQLKDPSMIGYPVVSRWRKASHSNSQGACVQVAQVARGIAVRDTTDQQGPALTVTPAAWRAFTVTMRRAGGM